MNAIYTSSFTVKLHEIDHHGLLKTANLFNYFQSISSEQSADWGIPITDLLQANLTWVVSRYHLQIRRLPRWRETITIRTWRSEPKELFVPREFEIVDQQNEPIILATSSFMLLNYTTKKPVSPQQHLPQYPIVAQRAIVDDFSPLPVLTRVDSALSFSVRRHDLDVNKHVNNSKYAEWALETVPDEVFNEYLPVVVEVAFRGEACYGDQVISQTQLIEVQPTFLHKLVRQQDGKELTRLRSTWRKFDY